MYITNTIKKKVFFLITAVTISLILVITAPGLLNSTFAASASPEQPTKRTLNVSGQGTIKVSPDIAYITVGAITEHVSARTAQQKNAESMDKLVTSIKAAGIAKEDIKTVNYSIYPKYDYNKETGESKIIGYSVSNSVMVTIKDMTKTGKIIDLASQSGANMSSSISFDLSDYEKYYNEALKAAVKIAKKRAEIMAEVIGITLKIPVSISESGGFSPIYNYRADYTLKSSMGESATTPVEAGTIEIKATVNMTYEY